MSENPAQNLARTDIPATVPWPPTGATRWAADRLGESGWETLTGEAGPKGGQPARWLELPCRPYERWQAGVYRIHWQTTGKRPLGTSEPFSAAPGDPGQGEYGQDPQRTQQAAPLPSPPAPPQPELVAAANQLAAQLKAAKTPKAPAMDPLATTFLAIEERSHMRQQSILEHHKVIADSQTRAFELYLGRVDERDRLHQHELEKLRDNAAHQIQALAEQAQQRESALAEQLAKTRIDLVEQGEQIAELAAEPELPVVEPETTAQKLAAIMQMAQTPEAQALVAMIRATFFSQGGDPAAAALPSPVAPVGGSVGE